MTFNKRYDQLEQRFITEVELQNRRNDDIWCYPHYLPNLKPEGPVDFILVAQQPSMGMPFHAPHRCPGIVSPVPNFAMAFGDFFLHACIRRYLCQGPFTYHLTDLSKAASPVGAVLQYELWYPLLAEELGLLAKDWTRVLGIGGSAHAYLSKRSSELHAHTGVDYVYGVPHFATQGIGTWRRIAQANHVNYKRFRESHHVLTRNEIDSAIRAVLKDHTEGAEWTVRRLANQTLTEDYYKLMYCYAVRFERLVNREPDPPLVFDC